MSFHHDHEPRIPWERLLAVLACAFVAGVVIASCKAPTAITCTVTGRDSTRVYNVVTGDSAWAYITVEWCE